MPMSFSTDCSESCRMCLSCLGRLMRKAQETGQTLYEVKYGMFAEYLRQELKTPSIKWILRKSCNCLKVFIDKQVCRCALQKMPNFAEKMLVLFQNADKRRNVR